MSILSALKAKGAKGKNIEEAVKTLPMSGGGDDSGILVVHGTISTVESTPTRGSETETESKTIMTLDKTWQQLHDATFVILLDEYDDGGMVIRSTDMLTERYQEGDEYGVSFSSITYTTDSANGYPYRTLPK